MSPVGPVTIVQLMTAAAFLTVALTHLLVWLGGARLRDHLLFATVAAASAGDAIAMSFVYRTTSPAEVAVPYKWNIVAGLTWLIAVVWFVEAYSRTSPGRRRLAFGLTLLALVGLVANAVSPGGLTRLEITGLRESSFLGQRVAFPTGPANPWHHVTDLAQLGLLAFVVDCARQLGRQGNRRRAWFVGGLAAFLLVFGVYGVLMNRGVVQPPYLDGYAFLLVTLVLSHELTADVVKKSALTREIAANEKRWRWLLENVELVVVGLDAAGRVDYVNPHFLSLTGYTAEEVLGQPWFERFVPEEQRAAARREFQELLERRGSPRYESPLLTKGGWQLLVKWSVVTLRDPAGNVVGALGIGEDLTARRSAEQKFELAVQASPTALILVDERGWMLLANKQTEKLFGYSARELIGRPVEILVPESLRGAHPGHRAAFGASPSARPMGAGRDLFARRKDGSDFPVEIGLSPIQAKEGLLVLTAVVDITERRRSEDELRRHRQELAHVARVSTLGELSASLAHELNQPLTAVLSNAQAAQRLLAAEPPDIQEVREILGDIVADDQRAGEVIRRLRALVRKEELAVAPIDVAAVVGDVVLLLQSDAVLRNCSVSLDFAPDLPLVRGDRIQLQQVALNLLLNAFEAVKESAPANRRVAVAARLDGNDLVKVTVGDRGHGLRSEDLERIFEPFHTTKVEGLGMGLAIGRSIVVAHGGRLWAESNAPEPGATFCFTLPVA